MQSSHYKLKPVSSFTIECYIPPLALDPTQELVIEPTHVLAHATSNIKIDSMKILDFLKLLNTKPQNGSGELS